MTGARAPLDRGTKLLLYIFTDFDVALIDVHVVDSWQADNGYAWRYAHSGANTHAQSWLQIAVIELDQTEFQPAPTAAAAAAASLHTHTHTVIQFWAFRKQPKNSRKKTSARMS